MTTDVWLPFALCRVGEFSDRVGWFPFEGLSATHALVRTRPQTSVNPAVVTWYRHGGAAGHRGGDSEGGGGSRCVIAESAASS